MKNTFWTFFKTQVKLSIRSGDMLIFGIAMPVGIMLLIGFISSPETILSSFSGVSCVGMCASAFMGIPLTLAGLRYEKILKRYKVSPVSPALILAAHCLVQLCYAIVCGIIIYLIAHFGFGLVLINPLRYVLTFVFCIAVIFSFGFLIGALVPDNKTVNWVTTLIYFPSLFISGSTVPYAIMPHGLQVFSDIFPMTQAIKLMTNTVEGFSIEQDYVRIICLAVCAVICYLISVFKFKWE